MSDFKLSDQQYKIMRVLWDKKEASAKDVQIALGGELAHTTVGTMLSRLEKRDILSSQTRGRERIYKPEITDSEVRKSMVSNLVSTIFKGDPSALVAHLVNESDIEEEDLDSIRAMLEEEGK